MRRTLLGALALGVLALGVACGDDDDTTSTPAPSDQTTAPGAAAGTAGAPAATLPRFDSSFGTAGVLKSALSATEHDRFMAVAIANDGSVYAAGFVTQGGDQAMALAKFNASGAPDKSFGKDGVAVVNVASGGKTVEVARAVAIQSSGKIIISGPIERDTSATGDAARDTDVAVVRFDATGKLDASFGREGIARIDFGPGKATSATAFAGDTSWGMGSLAGDKIVVFGSKLTAAGGDRTDTDFVLAGLTSSGALDTAFGQNGMLVLDRNGADNPRNLIVQPDGRIVATGYSTIGGVVQPILIRTSAAGVLDASFGDKGIATAKVLDGVAESYAVALQGDAYISAGYGRGADTAEKVDMTAGRFSATGVWDKAFGASGVARLDLAKEDDRSRDVATLADGRILTVGSGKMTATNIDAMVALWSKDGRIVTEFGTSGYVLSDLGGPADAWFGVAVSPDKKFAIVAGYKGTDATSGGNDDAVLGRINF